MQLPILKCDFAAAGQCMVVEECRTSLSGGCHAIADMYAKIFGGRAEGNRRSMRASRCTDTPPLLVGFDHSNFLEVMLTMRPRAWLSHFSVQAELLHLEAIDWNQHVHVVDAYNMSDDRPMHQLEFMNTDIRGRGAHWFILLHSRVAMQGPADDDRHFCLDPNQGSGGSFVHPSAKNRYKDAAWDDDPLETLFHVGQGFPRIQQNGHDCGPGACLLAKAVIKQFGRSGSSEDLPMKELLQTPLSDVRMEMALRFIVRTGTPSATTRRQPLEVIELLD